MPARDALMTAPAAAFAAVPGPPVVGVAVDVAGALASAGIVLDVVLIVTALVLLVAGSLRRPASRARATVTVARRTEAPAATGPLLAT
jgi:hypothetical protein